MSSCNFQQCLEKITDLFFNFLHFAIDKAYVLVYYSTMTLIHEGR